MSKISGIGKTKTTTTPTPNSSSGNKGQDLFNLMNPGNNPPTDLSSNNNPFPGFDSSVGDDSRKT